jgi:hypothetical protein
MRRALGAALAIVVAVGVTVWIRDRAPHPEDWQGPFLRAADVGEPVHLGNRTITVEGMSGGRGLVIGGGEPRPTGGVWLVVDVSIATEVEPAALGSVELVDERGRSFAPASTNRFDQPIVATAVQPGTVARGGIAFEVPFDIGAQVSFRAGPKYTLLDAVTDVTVPIPAAAWAAWSADGSQVDLPRRTVEAM